DPFFNRLLIAATEPIPDGRNLMSRQDYVEQTISELGTRLGIPELALDATDRASFSKDDILMTIHYVDQPIELLWLFVDLGEVGTSDAEVLSGLLQLGFPTWTSNCMTIGIDDSGQRAIGHSNIPVVYLTAARLHQTVEYMLEAAAEIRDHIQQHDFELVGNE
ncbi:MAG: type III secretion system chaperone, partial [Pirellulales bacterium]|nr:type III secretion system chaperone [Pirellulales bacterium]